ncbi:MAG: tRNA (adenosine(37)-N6)-threonylcarbamoyltransferase complex dimerization subunit type 1 TsaB [Anaerolineales bacterium]|nr:tRNA (adenosine(37)-N6)-threonylcarbamoyltransferase complex dimerization subunit type 1 TsaB [Anaerolineales bacterium]
MQGTILAFDTATTTASVAAYSLATDQLLGELTWAARRRHTQELLVQTDRLLQLLALTPGDVTHLAVTTGPGSFTGVRIAISVVKGMSLALPDVQVLGMPTLRVSAAPWLAAAAATPGGTIVCACIQAGRGRYNWTWFPPAALELYRPAAADHTAGSLKEFVAALEAAPGRVWLVGEVDPPLQAEMAHAAHVSLVTGAGDLRRAGYLAALAERFFAVGMCDEASSLQPIYLHAP